MSNLRRQAANALGKCIAENIRLAQPPTIIAAPPSSVADYPSVAIWLEKFSTTRYAEDELEVDANNVPLIGARALLCRGSAAAHVQDGKYLSKVGTMQATGRIWVGCRLPPLREELEEKITRLFDLDSGAPGRLMFRVDNPVIDGVMLPWRWPIAVFTDDSEWSDEYAFAEKMWAWIHIELIMDVLVTRSDPRILPGRFFLDVDAETNPITPVAPPTPDFTPGSTEWFTMAPARQIIVVDLVIGTNKIPHKLGRSYLGYTITPTLLTAAFTDAINATNPHPELEIWIDVAGAHQPGATLEVF